MDISKNYKLIIFLLLPFFLGWLINSSSFFLTVYGYIIWILNIGFILYWLWVGKQFGKLRFNPFINFLLGNIIWVISFGLFIWQFLVIDDSERNMFLAVNSQHYTLFTVMLSTRFVMIFEEVIDSTQVMITSYIFMLVIFGIGFMYESIGKSRTKRNNINGSPITEVNQFK